MWGLVCLRGGAGCFASGISNHASVSVRCIFQLDDDDDDDDGENGVIYFRKGACK